MYCKLGLSEIAMGGENIARQMNVSQYETYPGVEGDEEDDIDVISQSFDLHPGNHVRFPLLCN